MKKLVSVIRMTGKIHVIDGLCIQGDDMDLDIGGADNLVIKNPLTREPYIPGSSLKGKLRSQLERSKYGTYSSAWNEEEKKKKRWPKTNGEPCGCGLKDCEICTVFGAHKNTKADSAPTRVIVRDAHMTRAYREFVGEMPVERNSIEMKAENCINRNTGTAEHPRFTERVAGGDQVCFDYEILLQVLEGDDGEAFQKLIEEGMNLVQKINFLGGGGSRGNGNIEFIDRVAKAYSMEEVAKSSEWEVV